MRLRVQFGTHISRSYYFLKKLFVTVPAELKRSSIYQLEVTCSFSKTAELLAWNLQVLWLPCCLPILMNFPTRQIDFDWHSTNYQIKKASTVLCSDVKHTGSGRVQEECRGKQKTSSNVFLHFLNALPLFKCFTTKQSMVEASLFVL